MRVNLGTLGTPGGKVILGAGVMLTGGIVVGGCGGNGGPPGGGVVVVVTHGDV